MHVLWRKLFVLFSGVETYRHTVKHSDKVKFRLTSLDQPGNWAIGPKENKGDERVLFILCFRVGLLCVWERLVWDWRHFRSLWPSGVPQFQCALWTGVMPPFTLWSSFLQSALKLISSNASLVTLNYFYHCHKNNNNNNFYYHFELHWTVGVSGFARVTLKQVNKEVAKEILKQTNYTIFCPRVRTITIG